MSKDERRQVKIAMSPEEYERFQKLKQALGLKHDAEVIRYALKVLAEEKGVE